MIALIDKLHESGDLQKLIGAGLVSSSLNTWREVYHDYEAELVATGSKMQAMSNAADNNGVSVGTVRNIRDRLEARL